MSKQLEVTYSSKRFFCEGFTGLPEWECVPRQGSFLLLPRLDCKDDDYSLRKTDGLFVLTQTAKLMGPGVCAFECATLM